MVSCQHRVPEADSRVVHSARDTETDLQQALSCAVGDQWSESYTVLGKETCTERNIPVAPPVELSLLRFVLKIGLRYEMERCY